MIKKIKTIKKVQTHLPGLFIVSVQLLIAIFSKKLLLKYVILKKINYEYNYYKSR
jgi:hypothetical protein